MQIVLFTLISKNLFNSSNITQSVCQELCKDLGIMFKIHSAAIPMKLGRKKNNSASSLN